MTQARLRFLNPSQITVEDLEWLKRATGGKEIRPLFEGILSGALGLYRIEGLEGVILAERLADRTFHLCYLAGRGLWKQRRRLMEEIERVALDAGCRRVEVQVRDLRLQRAYEKAGLREVARVLERNLG